MRYSVYDYRTGKYTYYDGPGDPPATGSFRAPVGGLDVPETVAARLPAGCRQVGVGDEAQGIIATSAVHLGALAQEGGARAGGGFPWAVALAAAVAGYLAGCRSWS